MWMGQKFINPFVVVLCPYANMIFSQLLDQASE